MITVEDRNIGAIYITVLDFSVTFLRFFCRWCVYVCVLLQVFLLYFCCRLLFGTEISVRLFSCCLVKFVKV
jgi:hypothetical protein